MKSNYLFPYRFKKIGWLLIIPGVILGILYLAFEMEPKFLEIPVFAIALDTFMGKTRWFTVTENNILDEIITALIVAGGIFVAFSRQKSEDEFISQIRLESLVWATYVNYAILIFTALFIYDMTFFWVLVLNMYTVLFFFIARFHWALYLIKNKDNNEE
jgi:hypothetical protein